MRREQIGGLLFLTFSVCYGLAAMRIPSLPVDKFEAMNARSLPYALAILGSVLSLVLIFSPRAVSGADRTSAAPGSWRTVSLLLVAIVVYGVLLDALGFPLATAFFLAVASVLLGERRWLYVVCISAALVGALWLILVPGLDVYLAPGSIWQ